VIVGVGIDIVEVDRVAKLIRTYPKQLNRIFTKKELKETKKSKIGLAEVFAAKEAVLKVLGTGWKGGMNWTDVEVSGSQSNGKAKLTGVAKKWAKELKVSQILVSVSSTKSKSVAQAIGFQ